MQQLLPSRAIAPVAIRFDDRQQIVGRFALLAERILDDRQVEARLMVVGVLCEPRLELGRIAERGGILGKLDLRAYGGDPGVPCLSSGT